MMSIEVPKLHAAKHAACSIGHFSAYFAGFVLGGAVPTARRLA
jgi:hypothetical protein